MTTPTMKPPSPPRRRRRFLVVLAGLALLLLAFPAAWWYRSWSRERDLAAVIAELDRTDPDWRLADLQKKRRTFADEENSAVQIQRVFTALGRRQFDLKPAHYELFEDLPAAPQLNDQQLEILREELGKAPKALEEAHKLEKFPHGRHVIGISPDYISTLVEPLQQTRGVCMALKLDAYLRAHDGDEAGAARACRAILNTARSVGDEPFVIAMHIRMADVTQAIEAIERLLAQGSADPALLKDLKERLEREDVELPFVHALRAERAGQYELARLLAEGQVKHSYVNSLVMGGRRQNDFIRTLLDLVPAMASIDRAEMLRTMNRVIAAAQLPEPDRVQAVRDIQREVRAKDSLPEWLIPSFDRTLEICNRWRANVRATAVGLAAERYRLRHDRWPADLDTLVKEGYLKAVPRDPFDGQPLRWKRLPDGVVAYSVGVDKADNGGNVSRPPAPGPGHDTGFRLWDPAARRQPPLPAVPLEKGEP